MGRVMYVYWLSARFCDNILQPGCVLQSSQFCTSKYIILPCEPSMEIRIRTRFKVCTTRTGLGACSNYTVLNGSTCGRKEVFIGQFD